MRCSRHAGDSNPVSAANIARSAQDSRSLLTWRRNTVTSWRSTRISAFFDCALRAQQSQPAERSDTAVVTPRPAIMPDGHWPEMPQVTAVDDQFGTHRPVGPPTAPSGSYTGTATPVTV
jgi:hypothetical protein